MEPSESSSLIGEQPQRELRLLYCDDDDEIGDEVDECQKESFPSLLHMLPLAVCIEDVELGLFERFQSDLSPQIELALLLPLITLDSPLVNDIYPDSLLPILGEDIVEDFGESNVASCHAYGWNCCRGLLV